MSLVLALRPAVELLRWVWVGLRCVALRCEGHRWVVALVLRRIPSVQFWRWH